MKSKLESAVFSMFFNPFSSSDHFVFPFSLCKILVTVRTRTHIHTHEWKIPTTATTLTSMVVLLMNDDGDEYRSVMAALEHGLSSLAMGPSGAGKIETFKEITRAVGKKSIVFNCSASLDYFVLAKFFKVLTRCARTHSILNSLNGSICVRRL